MSRESDANDTRIAALAALEETRAGLHNWRFLSALKEAGNEDRDAAANTMLHVALARQALSSAILGEIVEELEQQEAALKQATGHLDEAIKKLDQVKPFLDAAASVLKVVAKIVSFL